MSQTWPLEVINTLTLCEHVGKTTITLRGGPINATAEERKTFEAGREGMQQGFKGTLDQLAEYLANASNTADREIVSTRVVDAPRELVWKAWTDPDHLAQWWGPKGFTNTFHEFDLRPGGIWRFVMHGPDGTGYKNKSVFVEIVKPERIVFDHVSGPQFQVGATFAEQAGKTEITFRMIFKSAAECAKVRILAVDANEQNFDRLEVQLAKMASWATAA